MIALNHKDYGSGPPIIILHGLFGMLDNWQTIARSLSEQYSVYLLDLRNHGKSPHTSEMSYPLMATDVQQFMETNWIYEAIVIGHSMGGKVAMQLAFDYPDFVKKLIVIDIAPKTYKGGHENVFAALATIDLANVTNREQVEQSLTQNLPNDTGTVQFLLKNLTRTPEGTFDWKMNLPILRNNYPQLMATVTGEPFNKDTLFIKGGDSHYIQKEDEEHIKSLFPKAQFVTIEEAGHWVHADKPKELINKVFKFINK